MVLLFPSPLPSFLPNERWFMTPAPPTALDPADSEHNGSGSGLFSVVHGVHEGAGQRVRQRAELAPSGGCRTGLAWSGWRGGGQSVAAAASSAMAVRAEDFSAMVLPAVQAASSAVVARRLMARGMPRAQEWMTRTASSENRVSLRPAWVRWARRYPSASGAGIAGEGV